MVIYWLTWFFICCANLFGTYRNRLDKVFFVLMGVYLFFFVGFRYQVGGDWYNYLFFYDLAKYMDLHSVLLNGDPAYNLLNYFGNKLEYKDTILVNAICGFLVLFFLIKLSLRLKSYWLVFLIYYPYHFLVVSTGYTRQSVAIAIILWAFINLLDGKLSKFLLYTLLAALFHKTAIILMIFLPVAFLARIKNSSVSSNIYIILSLFFLTFLLYFFGLSESNIYLQGNEEVSSKGFFIRWIYHLIPLSFFYYHNNFFKQKSYYSVLRYMSLLVLFMLPLGVFFSTLADRFNLYLIFFDIFVLCSIFFYKMEKYKKVMLMLLIFFYSMQMFLWFFFGEWAMKAWVPYQNYISNYLLNSVF